MLTMVIDQYGYPPNATTQIVIGDDESGIIEKGEMFGWFTTTEKEVLQRQLQALRFFYLMNDVLWEEQIRVVFTDSGGIGYRP